ncbi:MAG: Connector [Bacteriophage sp.]|nr:MAG: Connector [Bacteriophage sp.]
MNKKDNIYKLYQQQIRDKDTAVTEFIANTLAKTQSMFEYEGLPDSIPQKELERLLQTTGNAFVTSVDGVLYALSGGKGGEPDVYGRATLYTVANPALKLNKTYDIQKDGVLIENDSNGESLLPLIGRYAVLYTDGLISLNTASVLTRITMLISASDDKTKQSADEFLRKIQDGEFSIIGENAFFKGVNMQTAPTTNSVYITQLIELIQYYKASMYNELGLNANYNMKRERLNLGEVSMNVDVLLPYVDNMLKERQNAVEKINEMFDTEISVKLASSWGLERDNYNALAADLETAKENPDLTEEPDPTEETTETDGNDTETDGNDTETDGNDTETEETKETETDGNDTETEETEETEENEENKDDKQ